MPEYRVYMVGDDGHFVGREEMVCADDAKAIEKANGLANLFAEIRAVVKAMKP